MSGRSNEAQVAGHIIDLVLFRKIERVACPTNLVL
jgi:hypothetical protein